jgi:hypothetical protein
MTGPGTPLSRFLDEAYRDLDALFPDAVLKQADATPIEARKLAYHVPVSCCLLTDTAGTNHCQHPPRVVKPLPWTWRARERWWDLRENLVRRLAGHRWPNEEE